MVKIQKLKLNSTFELKPRKKLNLKFRFKSLTNYLKLKTF